MWEFLRVCWIEEGLLSYRIFFPAGFFPTLGKAEAIIDRPGADFGVVLQIQARRAVMFSDGSVF